MPRTPCWFPKFRTIMPDQAKVFTGPAVERDSTPTAVSFRSRILVFLLLACGLVATGMLSYQWLFKQPLPGCGPQSACQRATASEFALFFRIPVAYFGFAFLCAMTAGWLNYGRSGVPGPLLWATRAGAVVSLVFLVLMVEHDDYCVYCLAAHACTMAVCGITEIVARSSRWLRPSFLLGGAFLTVLLGFHYLKNYAVDAYHSQRDAVTRKIIDDLVQSEAGHGGHTSDWLPVPAPGGTRLGPADARIRITVFFDYQCPFCKSLD